MTLIFNIEYRTSWGEEVRVLGSIPELGNNQPNKATPLHTVDGIHWTAEVDIQIPGNGSVEYSYHITTVTVGWPAEQPEQVDRLPLEAIVHEEVYHDYTPQDIDRLYAYKESLPENKQFILENNKETLAQVFTDVRYTKKDSEAMSENLWKIMKKQGF
jgi:hypothetical protein